MFSSLTFSLLAAIFYSLAAAWVVLHLFNKAKVVPLLVRLLGLAGWFLHSLALANQLDFSGFSYLGLLDAVSVVNWLLCGLVLLLSLAKPSLFLAAIIFPLAAASLIVAQFYKAQSLAFEAQQGLVLHIVISFAAYSFLVLAAVQALLFGLQNSQLKKRNFTGLAKSLPPLQTMESLLFEFIYLGQVLLSLGILSGFIFLDNLFAPGLLHKTLLSIAAWVIFGSLILGHKILGWRGQTAVRFTLGGSCLLLLAYFGSKFVLQFILAT